MIASRAVRLAAAALALGASAACTQALRSAQLPDPCAGAGVDTTGWKVADAGPFRFSVPSRYQPQRVQGYDSYVGQWLATDKRGVHFDWGMYSSSLKGAATILRDHVECTTGIGGHPVKVVAGFDAEGRWETGGRKYVVAATWRDVQPGTHLTISVTAPGASDVPMLLSIVRSVRFQPGTPAPPF
jgi:hypothetical protein